jgi:cyclohexanecarboxylate-CoA ligase
MRDLVTSPDRRAAYERGGHWDGQTLAGRIVGWAEARPTDVAVVDGRGDHTYGALVADAARLASHLHAHGVEPGSVVSVQLPKCYEAVVTAVAIQGLGAVINSLLPNYRAKELAYVFAQAEPRVVVTPAEHRGFDHRPLIDEVRRSTGVHAHHVVVDDSAAGGDARFDDTLAGPGLELLSPPADAVSELIFTSGTEAIPRRSCTRSRPRTSACASRSPTWG